MANPRMPFLYPNIYRAIRSCEPTTYRSIRAPPARCPSSKAKLHTSHRRAQDTYQQRYGPAASPVLPPPPKPRELSLSREKDQEGKKESLSTESAEGDEIAIAREKPTDARQEDKTASPDKKEGPEEAEPQRLEDQPSQPNKELDIVLSIPSPSEVKGESSKHPHLEASPYEHHFDTYSLVQQLAQGGFSHEQAVTVMKAVRLMLAVNLDMAKDGLVSKSDVENETYLFRAACSELRTTLQSARHSETQRQRSTRAQLQHETDILNQKATQDLLSMREDLKGMFNDRKLALQEEKRKIDGKISELNYEITVLLNSDSKSEVEGLRWVLTRRAAMAIAMAAFMTLSALNYSSIKTREKEEIEKRKKAAKKAQEERSDARYTTPSRTQGTQTDSASGSQNYEESLG